MGSYFHWPCWPSAIKILSGDTACFQAIEEGVGHVLAFPEVCATPACVEDFGISWRLLLPVAGEFLWQGRRGKPRAYV